MFAPAPREAESDAGSRPSPRASRPVRSRPDRTRTRLAILLLAILLVGILAASGVLATGFARGVEARLVHRFASGQAELEAGRGLLKQATAEHRADAVAEADGHFRAGRRDFAAVRDDPDLRALAVAGPVPGVGTRVSAVRHLANMGVALADAGSAGAAVDALMLAPAPEGEHGQGSKRIVAILAQADPLIAQARGDFKRARGEAAAVDPSVLPAGQRKSFAAARASIDKGIAGLEEFDRLAPVLNEVLGVNGGRTYLIEQVNQTELRAGGGYIGTYSLLTADKGTLTLERSGDTHTLPEFNALAGQAAYVGPPATMVEFLKNRSWSLQDSNFFPDFPSNAKAAEQFATTDFGRPVDGVISIDLSAIAALLQVTGPLNVPGIGTVDTNNMIDKAVRLDVADPNHKSILFQMTGPLMDRITNLSSAQWPQLLGVLNQLAGQRHLQTYFNRDLVQSEMSRFAWTGELRTADADFMLPMESNFGGNKSNYWLTRKYDLTLTHSGTQLHHRLVVDLTLDRHLMVSPLNAFYRCYFRLYTGAAASNLTITNVKADDRPNSPPVGLKLVDGWQQLNPSLRTQTGQLQIVYEWDVPWTANARGEHRVYWQKQPGTLTDGVTIHWAGGSPTPLTTDIGQDRVLVLRPGAAASVEPGLVPAAKLPGVSV